MPVFHETVTDLYKRSRAALTRTRALSQANGHAAFCSALFTMQQEETDELLAFVAKLNRACDDMLQQSFTDDAAAGSTPGALPLCRRNVLEAASEHTRTTSPVMT